MTTVAGPAALEPDQGEAAEPNDAAAPAGPFPAILLTRPAARSDHLAARLRAAGRRVHAVPAIATEPIAGAPAGLLAALRAGTMPPDWLVITSPVGAGVVVEALAAGHDRATSRALSHAGRSWRIAAVGPATGRILEAAGWSVALIPIEARGSAIAAALAGIDAVAGRRILLARADGAGRDLPDLLRAYGAIVEEHPLYRTIEGPPASIAPLRAAFADPDLGAIVLASGSAARGIRALADAIGQAASARVASLPIVSIGPVTSTAVRAAGLWLGAEAARPDDDAILAAIDQLVPTERRSRS